MKKQAYEIIVDSLIEKMETAGSWKKLWRNKSPVNIRGTGYRGINNMILQCQPYSSNIWLTFNQAKELGGQVKKGEEGTPIVFWKLIDSTNEEIEPVKIPFLRYYTVFNLEQTTLSESDLNLVQPEQKGAETLFQEYLKAENIQVTYNDNEAYYQPALDKIALPFRNNFINDEAFFQTAFHEMSHSTGHKDRLNREIKNKFGDEKYSLEELVAEISSAYLMSECGFVSSESEENSAAYLRGWLKVLKNDKKMIIEAAQKAQKAADYIKAAANIEEKNKENAA